MNTRTRQRLKSSISARVAVAGIALTAFCALLAFAVQDGMLLGTWPVDDRLFGVWTGVTALAGLYITAVALVVLGAVEFLRYTGY